MTLDEVKAFMSEVGWGVLATSGGKTVGARPMGGWAWFGKELWCATFDASDKVGQIRQNPQAEYCFCSAEGFHVRIAGPCTISTDNADKKALYDACPVLGGHIADPTMPAYVVIRMVPDRVRAMKPDGESYEPVLLDG